MTHRTIQKNDGYSKKELIKIIEKIDADKHQMKHQTQKPNINKRSRIRTEQINTNGGGLL